MFFDSQNTLDVLIVAAVFGLVFALWLGYMFVSSLRRSARASRIKERLELTGGPADGEERILSLWRDDGTATTTVINDRQKSSLEKLDQLCHDAGWDVRASTLVLALLALIPALVVPLHLLTSSIVPGLGASVGVLLIFWTYLKHCVARKLALFENQFVDALDLAARSLRAGHPLVGAFQLISEEIPAPVSTLFAEVCQEQSMGMSLEQALLRVASSSSSTDVKLFSTSVIIQMRSGGNLADMMERLTFVIRERLRLNRRVRILTAQTQFSKRVLLVLPFIVFFVLNLVNSEYMVPLYATSSGHFLLALGAAGLLLGAWTMNKLAVLRY